MFCGSWTHQLGVAGRESKTYCTVWGNMTETHRDTSIKLWLKTWCKCCRMQKCVAYISNTHAHTHIWFAGVWFWWCCASVGRGWRAAPLCSDEWVEIWRALWKREPESFHIHSKHWESSRSPQRGYSPKRSALRNLRETSKTTSFLPSLVRLRLCSVFIRVCFEVLCFHQCLNGVSSRERWVLYPLSVI